MASIRDRSKKSPSIEATVALAGFPRAYFYEDTIEKARAAADIAEAELLRERQALADPRSTLPPSGRLGDERLLDTLARFERQRCQNSWHKSNIPGLRRVMKQMSAAKDPTIDQLKPSYIKNYILRARETLTERGGVYAWGTIDKHLSIVSSAIKWRAEQIDISPPPFVVKKSYYHEACQIEGLHVDEINNERDRRFEPGEEAALVRRLSEIPGIEGEQWLLLLQFALATGARLQEMVWAEWREIGVSGEEWHIPRKHSKTKLRTMMLTDEAVDALHKLRLMRDPTSTRLFHALGNRKRQSKPGAKMSAREKREEQNPLAYAPRRVSESFTTFRDQAGLPNFLFHDLRHEGISRFVLTQPDIPIKAVMTMVGHSSLKMLNIYAKLRPNELLPLMRRRAKKL